MSNTNICDTAINLGDKLKHYFIPDYITNLPIIDAGSNVGNFITKIRERGIKNHIIAIEPCRTNLKILKDKKFENVEIVPGALVGLNYSSSTISFTEIEGLSEWGSTTGINTNRGLSKGKKNIQYDVPVITLKDLITSPIDYLKMDIEGNETEIVTTLTCWLAQHIQQISLEVHNSDSEVLNAILQSFGYLTQWYAADQELFGIRQELLK
jgi:FkbM family methyltransferase